MSDNTPTPKVGAQVGTVRGVLQLALAGGSTVQLAVVHLPLKVSGASSGSGAVYTLAVDLSEVAKDVQALFREPGQ